jgi:hypothetical protein
MDALANEPANMAGPSQQTGIAVMIVLVLEESCPLLHLGRKHRADHKAFSKKARDFVQRFGIGLKPPQNGVSFQEGKAPIVILQWKFATREAVCLFSSLVTT